MKRLLKICVLSVFVSGCASTTDTPNTPQFKSWKMIGDSLATEGMPMLTRDQIDAKMPNEPISDEEFAEYTEGYEYGQLRFCSPENGFMYGEAGKMYMDQCAGIETESEFLKNWKKGLEEYQYNFFYQ